MNFKPVSLLILMSIVIELLLIYSSEFCLNSTCSVNQSTITKKRISRWLQKWQSVMWLSRILFVNHVIC